MIYNCISTPKISILFNVSPKILFIVSRGIRQGDPTSHILFIIMEDYLGITLQKSHKEGKIIGVKVTNYNVINIKSTSNQHFWI